MITPKEEKKWENFISGFQQTIEPVASVSYESRDDVNEIKGSIWKFVGFGILGAFLFGLPCVLLNYFTGIDFILVGATAGVMIFILIYLYQEKSNS